MTKIFIESDELEELWFDELPLEYSHLWLILKLNCNKGGIVNLNKSRLSYWAKFDVQIEEIKNHFKDHVTFFQDKLFINNFFADQNGYDLNLSNDAIRGRLKSFFEHAELTEELLRQLGYRFYIKRKDKIIQLHNIKEFLQLYQKPPLEIESIDECFVYTNNDVKSPIGEPMGKPRNSNSNSIGKSIYSNTVNEEIIRNTQLNFENYTKQVVNFKDLRKIQNQLTHQEFNQLLKIETVKKITSEVFWDAVKDLEKDKRRVINNSVYESLKEILTLPF